MTYKPLLTIVGIIVIVIGAAGMVFKFLNFPLALAVMVAGGLVVLVSRWGLKRTLSFLALFVVSALLFGLSVFLLGKFGVAISSDAKKVIYLICFLVTYIGSAAFSKKA